MKLIAILLILLCGCASVGKKIDRASAEQIKIGDTRESVRAAIGKPDGISKDAAADQEVWTYIHSVATAKPESFIPFAGAFVGGANTKTDMVTVFFDKDGKVSNISTSFADSETSMNLSTAGGERKETPKPAPDSKPAHATK